MSSAPPLPKAPIIEATNAHIAAMVPLFCEGQNEHVARLPTIFAPPTDHAAIRLYLKSYLKPRNPWRTRTRFAWVLQQGDTVAGYLLFQLRQANDLFFGTGRWQCMVDDIAVAPAHRGHGGARKLLQELTALTDTKPNCLCVAQVWRGNEASSRLFAAAGYTPDAQNFFRTPRSP